MYAYAYIWHYYNFQNNKSLHNRLVIGSIGDVAHDFENMQNAPASFLVCETLVLPSSWVPLVSGRKSKRN